MILNVEFRPAVAGSRMRGRFGKRNSECENRKVKKGGVEGRKLITAAACVEAALPKRVVCGKADGLHRPIERFRLEWLSDPIGPDAGRGATGV